MSDRTGARHLLAITIPTFGHVVPMANLLKLLHDLDANLQITFVLSACSANLFPQRNILPLKYTDRIKVVPLEDGLKSGLDIGITADILPTIKTAMDPPLKKLLEDVFSRESRITGVLSDLFVPMPAKMCEKRNLPFYCFVTSSAATLPLVLDLDGRTKTGPDEAFLSPMVDEKTGKVLLADKFAKFLLQCKEGLHHSAEVLVNSYRDLEPDIVTWIEKSEDLKNIPVRLVGPILSQEEDASKNQKWQLIESWLDAKGKASVVFVSWGSIAVPTPEQLEQVVNGLLASKRPFILILREFQQKFLPEKLKKETEAQLSSPNTPHLVLSWAPQQAILAHHSVGVFVSHCGWNAELEAISYGKPVVAWPMFADQYANADLLAEQGVAIKVKNSGIRSKNIVLAEELVKAIRAVGGEDGHYGQSNFQKKMRDKEQKATRTLQQGGSSWKDLEEFCKCL